MGDGRRAHPAGTPAERSLRRGPGNRRRACTGSYTVTGDHIDYVDDTGFTATGDVRDGVLFHDTSSCTRSVGDARDITAVFVDGQPRKWAGQVLDVNLPELRAEVSASRDHVLNTAKK